MKPRLTWSTYMSIFLMGIFHHLSVLTGPLGKHLGVPRPSTPWQMQKSRNSKFHQKWLVLNGLSLKKKRYFFKVLLLFLLFFIQFKTQIHINI